MLINQKAHNIINIMRKLPLHLKFFSLLFLFLAFFSLILTFINQGIIVTLEESHNIVSLSSSLTSLFSSLPKWLGLYPFALFFFFASLVSLTVANTKKRFTLYGFGIVFVIAFMLFSKYVFGEKRPSFLVMMILIVGMLMLTTFGTIVFFYKPKERDEKPSKVKTFLMEKFPFVEQLELKRQERISEKQAKKEEKALQKEEKAQERQREKEERLRALDEQRRKKEEALEEKRLERERALEERRAALRNNKNQKKTEPVDNTPDVGDESESQHTNPPLKKEPTQAPQTSEIPQTQEVQKTQAPKPQPQKQEAKEKVWDDVIVVDDEDDEIIYDEDDEEYEKPQKSSKPSSPTQAPQPTQKPEVQEDIKDDEEMSGIGGLSVKADKPRIYKYIPPSIDLLDDHPSKEPPATEMDLALKMTTLVQTLKSYGINCEPDGYVQGPTVTLYKLKPEIGVMVNKITSRAEDIARGLSVSSTAIRILTTIPNTNDIGIEIPNKNRQTVSFKDLVPSLKNENKFALPFSLGKTITGEDVDIDIAKAPHLLIAGATGSGKSVCVNSMITSLLYKKSPGEVRMIMVDPKVVELQMYNGIPHLLTPVITEPKKVIKALDFAIEEMERRYRILDGLHVRNIIGYNEKISEEKLKRERLPYILIIVDEFADLMMVVGKELEARISRLAAKARAVGIHLVLATQRPSVDVVTGTLKNNLPSRIAFRVPSGTDSRTIIDLYGAERLLGNGDMLYKSPNDAEPTRIQGAFLSDEETERVINYCKSQGDPIYIDESWFEDPQPDVPEDDDFGSDLGDGAIREDLIEKAWLVCAEGKKCSTSYIQRRLHVGYNSAANIVEELEARGIVGPAQGSKPREILKYPE